MDFKAQGEHERSKLLTVSLYVLVSMLLEAVAYFGLVTNLVKYFKLMGASNSVAAAAVNAFNGMSCVLTLPGGYIADTVFGKYLTTVSHLIIWLIGLLAIAASAGVPGLRVEDNATATGWQWVLLITALALVSLGQGGSVSNILAFGADQFDETKEKERKEKKSFFSWYFFVLGAGNMSASIFIVHIEEKGMWDLGFGISAIFIFFAIVCLVAGKRRYFLQPISGSQLTLIWGATKAAIRNRNKRSEEDTTLEAPLIENYQQKEHWMDWAIGPNDFKAEDVHSVKMVLGMFPFIIISVFYWIAFNQIASTFVLQGQQLERGLTILGVELTIPSASMSIFETATIIVSVPLYEFIVLPILDKLLKFRPTVMQRIGAGYSLATFSMIAAFIIERFRLQRYQGGKFYVDNQSEDEIEIVDMSIFWLIIPLVLIGLSRVLFGVSQAEFLHSEAPESMRGVMTAFLLACCGVGGYLVSLVILSVDLITKAVGQSWIPDNLNEGHLDYFYLLMAGIMAVVFVYFLRAANRYKHKSSGDVEHQGNQGTNA